MSGRIDRAYLRNSRHGKNLLKIMEKLAIDGPCNMYELSKSLKCSYALVHKSFHELSEKGFLYKYGRRRIQRKPGRKRQNKYKHETTLWGLSIRGIWTLAQVDKNFVAIWPKVKGHYNKLLGGYLEYFDIMFEIGVIRSEYGYSTRHGYPNPKMVAQALIFRTTTNEQDISRIYDEAVKLLEEYPHSTIIKIFCALESELARLRKMKKCCEILLEKLKPLRYPAEV